MPENRIPELPRSLLYNYIITVCTRVSTSRVPYSTNPTMETYIMLLRTPYIAPCPRTGFDPLSDRQRGGGGQPKTRNPRGGSVDTVVLAVLHSMYLYHMSILINIQPMV